MSRSPAIASLFVAFCAGTAGAQTLTGAWQSPELGAALQQIRAATPTPALAAAVVVDGFVFFNIAGVRRADLAEAGVNLAQPADEFLIGSVSKPFSAATMALAVDQGLIGWNTILGAAVPSIFPNSQTGYRYYYSTLSDLLSHASGMWYAPGGEPQNDWDGLGLSDYTRRLYYSIEAVSDQPVCDPEKCLNYDGGAIIGAHMFEALTGLDFAQFMRDNLFAPLSMNNSHTESVFDSSLSSWYLDPRLMPHTGTAGAFVPQGYTHSPRWMVGGITSCIGDLARFAYLTMYSPGAASHLYSSYNNQVLTTPVGRGNFSPGWGVWGDNNANGPVLYHAGSEGENYVEMLVWPARRVAIVAATNSNTPDAVWQAESWIESHLSTLFGAPPIPSADPLANAIPVTMTNSVTFSSSNLTDRSYSSMWTTPAGATSATITLTPPRGSSTLAPFGGVFLDEEPTSPWASVPGFVPSSNPAQGTPDELAINGITIRLYRNPFSRPAVVSDVRVGPMRRIPVGYQTGIVKVEIALTMDAPGMLTGVALVP